MKIKFMSDSERAVALDMFLRKGGKTALRPHEKALLIGEKDFYEFMSEWTDIVVLSCAAAMDKQTQPELPLPPAGK